MNWITFHHPDISLPVVRRRVGIEIMEMLEISALFLSKGGWGILNRPCYPNQAAYMNATSRLRKKGLLVKRSVGGDMPKLLLSEKGRDVLPEYFSPEKMWNRKWNGIWYLMVYDVPEVDRKYRNILRLFLKRMRMGSLQQSVWVTPRDIRPDFDDLATAANVDAFAYLFEARTVLGLPSRKVVEDAWDFERLFSIQNVYCNVMEKNIMRLNEGAFTREELGDLMRIAVEAYHGAFVEDPLLPSSLLPNDYLGKQVFSLHRSLFQNLDQQIHNLSSR